MSVWLIEAGTSMTQSAYYVDTISGKDLYSLSPNDAKQYENRIDAEIKARELDTEKIIHTVYEHRF